MDKAFINTVYDRCLKIKAAIDALPEGIEKERQSALLKVALCLFTYILGGNNARRI